MEFIREYTDLNFPDARILNKWIGKIVVHQREKDTEDNIAQLVEIYDKFVGMTVLNVQAQSSAVLLTHQGRAFESHCQLQKTPGNRTVPGGYDCPESRLAAFGTNQVLARRGSQHKASGK